MGQERIATSALLDALHKIEERPWGEDYRHGHKLNAANLAYLLRPYRIRAKQMKLSGEKVRGYESDQFADAFSRYCPPSQIRSQAGTPVPLSVNLSVKVPRYRDRGLYQGGRSRWYQAAR